MFVSLLLFMAYRQKKLFCSRKVSRLLSIKMTKMQDQALHQLIVAYR